MSVTLIRAAVLYIFVIFMIKLMGKRQIGEMQPAELVITILISEIVTVPMQDNSTPLIHSVIAVMLLVSLEIILSALSMKFMKLRTIVEGNPIIVIRNGKIEQKELQRLRMTMDDLLEALRQKDVFDINDVNYAIVETNGTMSVLLKAEKQPLTAESAKIKLNDKGLPCAVIIDGKIIKESYGDCGMTDEKLMKTVKESELKLKDILLMVTDGKGESTVIRKDKKP